MAVTERVVDELAAQLLLAQISGDTRVRDVVLTPTLVAGRSTLSK